MRHRRAWSTRAAISSKRAESRRRRAVCLTVFGIRTSVYVCALGLRMAVLFIATYSLSPGVSERERKRRASRTPARGRERASEVRRHVCASRPRRGTPRAPRARAHRRENQRLRVRGESRHHREKKNAANTPRLPVFDAHLAVAVAKNATLIAALIAAGFSTHGHGDLRPRVLTSLGVGRCESEQPCVQKLRGEPHLRKECRPSRPLRWPRSCCASSRARVTTRPRCSCKTQEDGSCGRRESGAHCSRKANACERWRVIARARLSLPGTPSAPTVVLGCSGARPHRFARHH